MWNSTVTAPRWGLEGRWTRPWVTASHMTLWSSPATISSGRWSACSPSKKLDEVIRRANDTQYGLVAAIWTRGMDKAHRFARGGAMPAPAWVNCYHVVDTTTPFGGFKMSGLGRENGEAVPEHYTEIKTVTIKLK